MKIRIFPLKNCGGGIKNLAFLLIFWSAVYTALYYVAFPLFEKESVSVKQIIISFFNGYYHMWYLYMIIGLYCIAPFLRCFVSRKQKNLVLLFICFSLLFRFTLPISEGLSLVFEPFSYWNSFASKFSMDFFGEFITYYLSGWYIVHIGLERKWQKRCLYFLGIASILITLVYVQVTRDERHGYSLSNLFIYFYSIWLFYLFYHVRTSGFSSKRKNIVVLLSNLSFGVYILHPVFLTVYHRLFRYSSLPLLYMVVEFCVIALISFFVCFMFSKTPYIKKLVRM